METINKILDSEEIEGCPNCTSDDVWFSTKFDAYFCDRCDFKWTIKPIKWELKGTKFEIEFKKQQ